MVSAIVLIFLDVSLAALDKPLSKVNIHKAQNRSKQPKGSSSLLALIPDMTEEIQPKPGLGFDCEESVFTEIDEEENCGLKRMF